MVIAVLVVAALVVGGVLLMHKSNSPATSTSSNSAAAVNNAILKTKSSASLGQYLTDPNGKALYTYSVDTSGVSNCTGTCLANWPAYVDTGATTGLPSGVGTLTRTDNSQVQYTYNGMPLYYFVTDGTGSPTGDGVNSFNLAKPAASSSSTSTTDTTPDQTSTSNSTSNHNY